MPVDAQHFKRAVGSFASGVTVVTTLDRQNQPRGMTVSAFSSLSLNPPLVLICIDHKTPLHDLLTVGRTFAVQILAEGQEAVSQRFATRESERFDGQSWTSGIEGTPILDGCLATIQCRTVAKHPGGDHSIVVGEVEQVDVSNLNPLLYFRGRYRALAPVVEP